MKTYLFSIVFSCLSLNAFAASHAYSLVEGTPRCDKHIDLEMDTKGTFSTPGILGFGGIYSVDKTCYKDSSKDDCPMTCRSAELKSNSSVDLVYTRQGYAFCTIPGSKSKSVLHLEVSADKLKLTVEANGDSPSSGEHCDYQLTN